MLIVTSVEVDSAHRLTFHPGKCRNLHGHRWLIEVGIETESFDNMVMDFGDLKVFLKQRMDHKLLSWDKDEALIQVAKMLNTEIALFPFETTAENIATVLRHELEQIITDSSPSVEFSVRVAVYETANNCARV